LEHAQASGVVDDLPTGEGTGAKMAPLVRVELVVVDDVLVGR
jgi:hypothetical protein